MKKSEQELYNDCLAYAVRLIEKSALISQNVPNSNFISDQVVVIADRFYEKLRYKNNGL